MIIALKDSKKLAETLPHDAFTRMLENVKNNISFWENPSRDDKGISRGIVWNLCAKNYDSESSFYVKFQLLREFGEYLPEEYQPKIRGRKHNYNPIHQKPIFRDADKKY